MPEWRRDDAPRDAGAVALDRRACLRRLGLAAAGLGLVPLAGCAGDVRRSSPPNVVLILADDLGSTDLGCYGADDLRTPALDRLAAAGLRFTDAYVNAPACLPSRASLLTGRHFMRVVGDDGLLAAETTVAEMLRAAGYRTACFGKWHLGHPPPLQPLGQGFDEFLGFLVGAMDNYSHFYYWGGPHRHVLRRDGQPWREDGVFFPDIVVREARRFIDAHRERPFFLYLPLNMPHYPLQPEARYLEGYAHMRDRARQLYGAFVTSMDAHIGQVLDHLDDRGLRQDTVVVFLSDHGHSQEERAFGGGGRSTPFRGHKGTLLEGGIRVPFILSAPGRLPRNQVRHQPVTSMDLLPTLADLAGAPLPDRPLDGRSLLPVLADGEAPGVHDELFWTYGDEWAVRHANWKVIGNSKGDHTSVYDLTADPGEGHDVIATHPEVATYAARALERWLRTDMATDPNVRRRYGAGS